MFGTKQGRQVHMGMQYINGGTKRSIHPGGIGDQSDPFPPEQVKIPASQYLNSGFYL
jgi:hypothetical protein